MPALCCASAGFGQCCLPSEPVSDDMEQTPGMIKRRRCAAPGPASAPPLGLGRPARRTPGHTAKLARSAQLIRYSRWAVLKALHVLGRSCRVQASPHCGQVMHDGWDQAETQTVSVP